MCGMTAGSERNEQNALLLFSSMSPQHADWHIIPHMSLFADRSIYIVWLTAMTKLSLVHSQQHVYAVMNLGRRVTQRSVIYSGKFTNSSVISNVIPFQFHRTLSNLFSYANQHTSESYLLHLLDQLTLRFGLDGATGLPGAHCGAGCYGWHGGCG